MITFTRSASTVFERTTERRKSQSSRKEWRCDRLLWPGLLPRIAGQNRKVNLMDVAKLVERFGAIHERGPQSKHELESWFAKYASAPDGWVLICHLALDNHDRKGWRTGLVRQMQTLHREVHGRDGSLVQIDKWMRSLEGNKEFDASWLRTDTFDRIVSKSVVARAR
jgi:hypothetical protein